MQTHFHLTHTVPVAINRSHKRLQTFKISKYIDGVQLTFSLSFADVITLIVMKQKYYLSKQNLKFNFKFITKSEPLC